MRRLRFLSFYAALLLALTACNQSSVPAAEGADSPVSAPAQTEPVDSTAGSVQPETPVQQETGADTSTAEKSETTATQKPATQKPATQKPTAEKPKAGQTETQDEQKEPEETEEAAEPEDTTPTWQVKDSGLPVIKRTPGFPDIEPVDYTYNDFEEYSAQEDEMSSIDTVSAETTALPCGATYQKLAVTLTDGSPVCAFAFEYVPGGSIACRTSFCGMLADTEQEIMRDTVSEMAAYEQQNGNTVAAAINGGYFLLTNLPSTYSRRGTPSDLVVRDGWIASSDDGKRAVGFYADGTAIIGRPYGRTAMTVNDKGDEIDISAINKTQSASFATLYTADFSDCTGSVSPSLEIVAKITGGRLGFGATLEAVVEKVGNFVQSTPLEEGYIVLSAQMSSSFEIAGIQLGDKLSFSTTSYDKRWYNVVSAVGGEDMLLHGGEVVDSAAGNQDPRTAVGIKADGTVVILAVQGRTEESGGLSKGDTGFLLKRLGCTEGVNLDGGGSTAMVVDFEGNGELTLVNDPSDGKQRKDSNGLVFVIN